MITILAQAQTTAGTMEISAVGALIAAVVTALLGAGGHKILTHKTTIADQPVRTKRDKEYATMDDLARVEAKQAQDARDIYTRLNSITVLLNKVDGKQEVILGLIKTNLTTTHGCKS